MMKIALALRPQADLVWTLAKQCGVDYAVGTINLHPVPNASKERQPWSYMSLARAKAAYEDGGFKLEVIESRPPMEKVKLGLPGRDEEIDVVCELIRNMGALEIPVWCPAWMPILGVMRTSSTIPSRGGAQVTGYDHKYMRNAPLSTFVTYPGGCSDHEQCGELPEAHRSCPKSCEWGCSLSR